MTPKRAIGELKSMVFRYLPAILWLIVAAIKDNTDEAAFFYTAAIVSTVVHSAIWIVNEIREINRDRR